MAFALDALGKHVTLVNRDPVPGPLTRVPRHRADRRRRSRRRDVRRGDHHGVQLARSHRRDRASIASFVINIDHHQGNTGYGALNWFDAGGGRVRRDGVRPDRRARRAADAGHRDAHLRRHPDRHRIVPLLGDLGPRRSTSAAPLVEAGVDPPRVARAVFDSNTLGRLRLFGAVLSAIELEHDGRLAADARGRGDDGARPAAPTTTPRG